MIADILNRFQITMLKKGPAQGVLKLIGGATFAQLLMVLASPVLSRLYSPTEMGIYSVLSAILAVVSIIASFRYELAIPLPKADDEASAVAVLSSCVVMATAFFTTVTVALWGRPIAFLLGIPAYAHYLWFIPIGVAIIGLYQVASYWAIRAKGFSVIAKTQCVQIIARLIVQLAGAAFGPITLLIGFITGQGLGSYKLIRNTAIKGGFTTRGVTRREIISTAKRYAKFPLYSTWSALFNTSGMQLPPMLFSALFSPAIAGIYSLTHRVIALPVSLVGHAIAQVFLAHAPQAHREGRLGDLVAGIQGKLALVAMPFVFFMVLLGPRLFGFVFGEEWARAGVFAQWMAPWIYFFFVTSPISHITTVLEKQAQGMALEALLVIVRVITLIAGTKLGSVEYTVALFSIGSAGCRIVFLAWMCRVIRASLWDVVVSPTLRALAYTVICLMPLFLLQVLGGADSGLLWPALMLSGLATAAMLVKTVGKGLLF